MGIQRHNSCAGFYMGNFKIFLSVIAIFLIVSCSKIRNVTDSIVKPSAREVYQRQFSATDQTFAQWRAQYNLALGDSIIINNPYVEKGRLYPDTYPTYSYIIAAKEGEQITVEVVRDSLQQKFFIDLISLADNAHVPLVTNDPNQHQITYAVSAAGDYRIVVQPEIKANTAFTLIVNKSPTYGFPVAGKGNAAIQSFWGYERDGGTRSHEGIDIFAARNTPIVAASNGVITRTGDMGLGGKQVWQRSKDLGHSLYYAHLDSISAVPGSTVSQGDTVGFMGSTGNAKGGSPHLHFGIYKGFGGAIDPLPFIFVHPSAKPGDFPKSSFSRYSKTKSAATLRKSSSTKSLKIGMLAANDTIKVLGQSKDWLHVQTSTNQKAFLHVSLVTTLK